MKIVSLVSKMEWSSDQKSRLKKLGTFIEHNCKKISTHKAVELISDAEILIVGTSGVESIDSFVLENCSKLKFITVLGVGTDFVDLIKARELGIIVSNLQGANSESVAEHIWGMILGLSKKIVESHIGTKEGKYEFFHYFGKELQGKTLGIIGFGAIGSKVARIAKGFDMKVIALNRSPIVAEGITFVSLNHILKDSDVIVITVPLNPETDKLIGDSEFTQMKEGVILISSSREAIIDKDAVLKSLESQKLFGYGYELEINSPSDTRFYKYANVIITPHNAFYTAESELKSNDMAVDNVEQFTQGTPKNVVN